MHLRGEQIVSDAAIRRNQTKPETDVSLNAKLSVGADAIAEVYGPLRQLPAVSRSKPESTFGGQVKPPIAR
jgi:hypothetical protein